MSAFKNNKITEIKKIYKFVLMKIQKKWFQSKESLKRVFTGNWLDRKFKKFELDENSVGFSVSKESVQIVFGQKSKMKIFKNPLKRI